MYQIKDLTSIFFIFICFFLQTVSTITIEPGIVSRKALEKFYERALWNKELQSKTGESTEIFRSKVNNIL